MPLNSSLAKRISLLIKILIVLVAAAAIFLKFSKASMAETIGQAFRTGISRNLSLFIFAFLLIPVNWALEALKWQKLVSVSEKITFMQAFGSVLSGLTVGTLTPNRFGEFAGRIFLLSKTGKLEAVWLSFIASAAQVIVTLLAGLPGFIILCTDGNFLPGGFRKNISYEAFAFALLLAGLVLVYFFLPDAARNRLRKLRTVPRHLFASALFLSAARYAVYAFQFFLLLRMMGVEGHSGSIFAGITVNYFLVTLTPALPVMEIFVRAYLAGTVLGSVSGQAELCGITAALIWIMNIAVPSVAGMGWVFAWRIFRKKT
ncbi:MAG TPA: lysylphosphatidylglycerol synthase domain-containing protein [Bacteroidia bacterium]|nr:lysylphosphatidylglycerol synthase domain-containing protein [Bacteroidia bacterium]